MLGLEFRLLNLQWDILLSEDPNVGADALDHQVITRGQFVDCGMSCQPPVEGVCELGQLRLDILDEVEVGLPLAGILGVTSHRDAEQGACLRDVFSERRTVLDKILKASRAVQLPIQQDVSVVLDILPLCSIEILRDKIRGQLLTSAA